MQDDPVGTKSHPRLPRLSRVGGLDAMHHPVGGRFGAAPPTDAEEMRLIPSQNRGPRVGPDVEGVAADLFFRVLAGDKHDFFHRGAQAYQWTDAIHSPVRKRCTEFIWNPPTSPETASDSAGAPSPNPLSI